MCNLDLGLLVITDQESGNRPRPLANIRRTRRPLVWIRNPAARLARRRGDRGRVARAGWGREAVGAPSNAPTRAAWFPWGLGVRAGPTVGSAAAAHGLVPDVARHASQRRVPETFSSSPVWPTKTPKSWTEVVQAVNSKVVDLRILYNFHKGRMAFFSTICAQIACQDGRFLGADE
jgi:hypothetical protein